MILGLRRHQPSPTARPCPPHPPQYLPEVVEKYLAFFSRGYYAVCEDEKYAEMMRKCGETEIGRKLCG